MTGILVGRLEGWAPGHPSHLHIISGPVQRFQGNWDFHVTVQSSKSVPGGRKSNLPMSQGLNQKGAYRHIHCGPLVKAVTSSSSSSTQGSRLHEESQSLHLMARMPKFFKKWPSLTHTSLSRSMPGGLSAPLVPSTVGVVRPQTISSHLYWDMVGLIHLHCLWLFSCYNSRREQL